MSSIYTRADDLASLPYSAGARLAADEAATLAGLLSADDATLDSALEGMSETDLAGLAADMARAEAIADAEIEAGRTLGGYDTTDPDSLGDFNAAPANSRARWGRIKRRCQCVRAAAGKQRQQRRQAAGLSPTAAGSTGTAGLITAQPGEPLATSAALPLFIPLTQPLAGWSADDSPEGLGNAAPALPGRRINWSAWRSPWDGSGIATVARRGPLNNEEAMALQNWRVAVAAGRKRQEREAREARLRANIAAARVGFEGLGFFKQIGRAVRRVARNVGRVVRRVAPAIVGAIPIVGPVAASFIPPPSAPRPAPAPAPRPAAASVRPASLTTGTAASTTRAAGPATFNTSTLALLAAGGALLFLAARR